MFRTEIGLSKELSFGNENEAMSHNDSHSSSSMSVTSCLSNLNSPSSSKSLDSDSYCTSSRRSSYSRLNHLLMDYRLFLSDSLEGVSTFFSEEPNGSSEHYEYLCYNVRMLMLLYFSHGYFKNE